MRPTITKPENIIKVPEPILVPVIFRMFLGEVVALFPTLASDGYGNYCSAYQHLGQHGAADYGFVVRRSRLATPEEYADLNAELISLGYRNMRVINRATPQMHRERIDSASCI
jgi:hypothetical protein